LVDFSSQPLSSSSSSLIFIFYFVLVLVKTTIAETLSHQDHHCRALTLKPHQTETLTQTPPKPNSPSQTHQNRALTLTKPTLAELSPLKYLCV
jgi:hypothetical protein